MWTKCRKSAVLLFLLVCCPEVHASERPNGAGDENADNIQLDAVHDFIKQLEEAYSCRIAVNSAKVLTAKIEISVVGVGTLCNDAFDTLIRQFDPEDGVPVTKLQNVSVARSFEINSLPGSFFLTS